NRQRWSAIIPSRAVERGGGVSLGAGVESLDGITRDGIAANDLFESCSHQRRGHGQKACSRTSRRRHKSVTTATARRYIKIHDVADQRHRRVGRGIKHAAHAIWRQTIIDAPARAV